jgi:hypothetical protein
LVVFILFWRSCQGCNRLIYPRDLVEFGVRYELAIFTAGTMQLSSSLVRLVGIRDALEIALREGQVLAGHDKKGRCKRRFLSNLNDVRRVTAQPQYHACTISACSRCRCPSLVRSFETCTFPCVMDSIAPKRGRFAEVSSSPWPEHSEAPSGVGNIEELLHAHHKDNGSLPARGINVVPEIDQLELQDTGSLPQLLAASSGPRIKSAHSVNGGATNENGGLSHLISPRGPGKMMTLNSYIDGTESSTAVLSNPHEGSASLYHQFVAHSTDASHSEKPNTDYGIPPFFESAGFLEPDNHSLAKYTFTWDHPAKEVFVTGTFDEWKKSVKLEGIDLLLMAYGLSIQQRV